MSRSAVATAPAIAADQRSAGRHGVDGDRPGRGDDRAGVAGGQQVPLCVARADVGLGVAADDVDAQRDCPTPTLCDLATPPSMPIRVRSSIAEMSIPPPLCDLVRRFDRACVVLFTRPTVIAAGDPEAAAARAGLGEGEVEDRGRGADDQAGATSDWLPVAWLGSSAIALPSRGVLGVSASWIWSRIGRVDDGVIGRAVLQAADRRPAGLVDDGSTGGEVDRLAARDAYSRDGSGRSKSSDAARAGVDLGAGADVGDRGVFDVVDVERRADSIAGCPTRRPG